MSKVDTLDTLLYISLKEFALNNSGRTNCPECKSYNLDVLLNQTNHLLCKNCNQELFSDITY